MTLGVEVFFPFERRKWRLCRDICSWYSEDDFGDLLDLREHSLHFLPSCMFWWQHLNTKSDWRTPH